MKNITKNTLDGVRKERNNRELEREQKEVSSDRNFEKDLTWISLSSKDVLWTNSYSWNKI